MLKLLWLDLETSGLEARKHQVLEVALSVADLADPFNAVPVFQSVVRFPQDRWDELHPIVREMHVKNGLLLECASATAPTVERVELRLLEHVPVEAERDDRPILAGSSVWFDHEFLQEHMPRLAKRLVHRHYDVSALKLYCQSQGMPKFKKAEAHRAGADILESITHAEECTTWLKANLSSKQR